MPSRAAMYLFLSVLMTAADSPPVSYDDCSSDDLHFPACQSVRASHVIIRRQTDSAPEESEDDTNKKLTVMMTAVTCVSVLSVMLSATAFFFAYNSYRRAWKQQQQQQPGLVSEESILEREIRAARLPTPTDDRGSKNSARTQPNNNNNNTIVKDFLLPPVVHVRPRLHLQRLITEARLDRRDALSESPKISLKDALDRRADSSPAAVTATSNNPFFEKSSEEESEQAEVEQDVSVRRGAMSTFLSSLFEDSSPPPPRDRRSHRVERSTSRRTLP